LAALRRHERAGTTCSTEVFWGAPARRAIFYDGARDGGHGGGRGEVGGAPLITRADGAIPWREPSCFAPQRAYEAAPSGCQRHVLCV